MSAPRSTFQLTLRHSIWRVTLDGVFYGDYRTKRQALESAEAGAQALRDNGRHVQIQTPDDAAPPEGRGFHLTWNKPTFGPLRPKWGAK
jgi:hypothetical protein